MKFFKIRLIFFITIRNSLVINILLFIYLYVYNIFCEVSSICIETICRPGIMTRPKTRGSSVSPSLLFKYSEHAPENKFNNIFILPLVF